MEFLKKLIEKKEHTANELRSKIDKCENVVEARELYAQLEVVKSEILELQEEMRNKSNGNAFDPMESLGEFKIQKREQNNDVYGSLEYRKAFMQYVQKAIPIPNEFREAKAGGDSGTTVTADIGKVIPTTILNEFIKKVQKVYGQIYARVRKLNVPGGVEIPISELQANFKWVTETAPSDNQKAGDINESVIFNYHIGEIKIATSLLARVVSLEMFENEITEIMLQAYMKAMDTAIISGTGSGQPLGITKDTRVTGNTGNIIEFNAADIVKWANWRKQLFAKVPLAKRGQGEFLFPASTVESYLMTMQDNNGNPIFKESLDGGIGNLAGKFFGRDCILVEPDIIKDFDTASAGDIIGIYWNPQDYGINTNLAFGMKSYYDEDKNEHINKALTIVDGKILDVSGCYLIKKKA